MVSLVAAIIACLGPPSLWLFCMVVGTSGGGRVDSPYWICTNGLPLSHYVTAYLSQYAGLEFPNTAPQLTSVLSFTKGECSLFT